MRRSAPFTGIVLGEILAFYKKYEYAYSLPEQIAGIISVFTYLLLSHRLLTKNRRRLKLTYSSIEGLAHRRLNRLVILLGGGWLAWLVILVIDAGVYDFSLPQYTYYPVYIIMSFTIYAIGYSGYFEKSGPAAVDTGETASPLNMFAEQVRPTADPALSAIAQNAAALMEESKLYLDGELRLKTVADGLGMPPPKLSEALKIIQNKNFYDFVNEYRVREVKRRLADKAYNHLTILSVAYDAGFNSKSTFNVIFKKSTGKTPKQYKNDLQKEVRKRNSDVSANI